MEKNRTVVGQLRVLETQNPKLYPVEIMALNSEVNRNNWQYVNLEQHLNEFLDIPILTAYVGGGMIVGDGHNYNMRKDPVTGEDYASFTASDAERIVGWIPKDPKNVRLENVDGTEWVIVKGYIWAWYAKEFVDQIARQGSMEVSIETLVTDESQGEDGVEIEEKYMVLGITVLGNGVEPAVAGANIKTLSELSELRSNMAENILKAASYERKETSESEPQNNENPKGVRQSMTYFSRKQLAELGAKFPEYKILAAVQDENGIRVCLMAKDASTSIYTMESVNDTIVPEKLQKVNARISFSFGEDCSVEADACDMTDALSAELVTATAKLDSVTKELNDANDKIKAMEAAEDARRVQAAKDKAKAVLNGLNANRQAKVQFEDSILDAVNADIDAGLYTKRENAEGKWIGEAEVEMRVKGLCMEAQAEMDRKAREAAESTFIFEKFNGAKGNEPDGIDGLLSGLDKII